MGAVEARLRLHRPRRPQAAAAAPRPSWCSPARRWCYAESRSNVWSDPRTDRAQAQTVSCGPRVVCGAARIARVWYVLRLRISFFGDRAPDVAHVWDFPRDLWEPDVAHVWDFGRDLLGWGGAFSPTFGTWSAARSYASQTSHTCGTSQEVCGRQTSHIWDALPDVAHVWDLPGGLWAQDVPYLGRPPRRRTRVGLPGGLWEPDVAHVWDFPGGLWEPDVARVWRFQEICGRQASHTCGDSQEVCGSQTSHTSSRLLRRRYATRSSRRRDV